MTDNPANREEPRRPGAPRPCSCTAARCARSSARPPRRCSSPRATSTPPPSRPRSASRARPASSTAATPIRPSPCSRSACGCWKVPEAARATATGMAAVTSALLCFLKAGDHVVAARALFGSCRYVVEDLCPRFGIASHADRRPRHRGLGSAPCGPTPRRSSSRRRPIPTLDLVDIAAVSRDRPCGRRAGGGRQRVRHAAAAEAAEARRRRRRLFRHQAHRRPGPLPRRRRAGLAGLRQGSPAQLPASRPAPRSARSTPG